MPEHPLQRAAILGDNPIESILRFAVKPVLFGLRFMPQQLGAHHRSERQRNHGGNKNRYGQRDREFAEQAADNIAHEQQRNEHRYQ